MINKKPYVIAEIDKDTPDVTLFKFKAQDGSKLDFKPGMFVMLHHKDAQTGADIGRAFSLASLPNDDTIEFAISMIHGRFTSYLDTAKVGDIYYVTGPYGQFQFNAGIDSKVMFIAGGTGIAPFLSMLRQIKHENLSTDVKLIYSVRFHKDIIRKEELEQYRNELTFDYCVTATREGTDEWSGEHGHVNEDMVKKHAPDITERTCYVCGPLEFTKAVQNVLVSLGVDKQKIKADVWG